MAGKDNNSGLPADITASRSTMPTRDRALRNAMAVIAL
jgi:hypothetical protein